MKEKRQCIFTGQISDAKLTISSDRYNWVKSVPCTKEFISKKDGKPLNDLEFRLVELFFEQELCRLKIEHFDFQMKKIRIDIDEEFESKKRRSVSDIYVEMDKINKEQPEIEDLKTKLPDSIANEVAKRDSFDSIRQEIASVDVPESVVEYTDEKETAKELTKEEKPVKKVVKKRSNLWG